MDRLTREEFGLFRVDPLWDAPHVPSHRAATACPLCEVAAVVVSKCCLNSAMTASQRAPSDASGCIPRGEEPSTSMAEEQKQPITHFLPTSSLGSALFSSAQIAITQQGHQVVGHQAQQSQHLYADTLSTPYCLHPRSHRGSSCHDSQSPSALSRSREFALA